MVRRPRHVLSGLALAALLTGCPAEQLGVELPRGGADAISQEDLKRDVWLVAQAPSGAAAAEAVAQRLGQMRLLPGFGTAWVRAGDAGVVACGRKDGADHRARLVVATGDPASVAGAVSWAGLVSLAKGWDLPGVPERTRILCVASSAGAAEALLAVPPVPVDQVADVVLLGEMHGPTLQTGAVEGRAEAVGVAAPGPTPSGAGDVDYRLVERSVRQALGIIDARG